MVIYIFNVTFFKLYFLRFSWKDIAQYLLQYISTFCEIRFDLEIFTDRYEYLSSYDNLSTTF